MFCNGNINCHKFVGFASIVEDFDLFDGNFSAFLFFARHFRIVYGATKRQVKFPKMINRFDFGQIPRDVRVHESFCRFVLTFLCSPRTKLKGSIRS